MGDTLHYTRFPTPLCEIILVGNEQGLCHLYLQTGEGNRVVAIDAHWQRNDDFFSDAIKQIQDYANGQRGCFNITLNPKGTRFQKQVWQALSRIP